MNLDTNVSLGFWPFQVFPPLSAAELARKLKTAGISHAWVSSVEAILAPDPQPWNDKLFHDLSAHPELHPVGVVNPTLGDWRDTLEECLARPELSGIKVFPNYHGYADNPQALDCLVRELTSLQIPLTIQARMEDERIQFPLMQVPGVSAEFVKVLAARHPDARFICLALYTGEIRQLVTGSDNIWADIAFAEALDTLPFLLREVPAERLLLGTHTPYFETSAAIAKLNSCGVDTRARRLIASENSASLSIRLNSRV